MRKRNYKKFMVVLILLIAIAIPFASKVNGETPLKYEKVVVYPGDTLWSIASRNKTSNTDIRKLIYEIRKLNKLESAVITPGQEILIPLK